MNAHHLLRYAHFGLAICAILLLVAITLAYPMAGWLPLPVLIIAHIVTMLAALGIKLGYVARLAALKQLDLPAH